MVLPELLESVQYFRFRPAFIIEHEGIFAEKNLQNLGKLNLRFPISGTPCRTECPPCVPMLKHDHGKFAVRLGIDVLVCLSLFERLDRLLDVPLRSKRKRITKGTGPLRQRIDILFMSG